MDSHRIALPRKAKQLPKELTQRNSELDIFIRVTGDSADKRSYGFQSNIQIARRLIRQNCSSYRPSKVDAHRLLCNSGEASGNPKLGSTCHKCRVGQFTDSGLFTGEVIGVSAAAQSLSASFAKHRVGEIRRVDEQYLSDLVNASENSI